uniref:Uncharacterized protein n=1 Tax=Anguilla anguilla TaxID=7936 RepID=A0A0E9SZR9_ANGAN
MFWTFPVPIFWQIKNSKQTKRSNLQPLKTCR